jgi:hypothetical protein
MAMQKPALSFHVIDFGPIWLLGSKTIVSKGKTGVAFVGKFRCDGTNDYLQRHPDRISPEGDIIIWMGGYDEKTQSFTEIPGVWVKPGCEARDDLAIRELPHCTMGICRITGQTRDLARGAHNKLLRLMREAGYEPDYSLGFSMEYYSFEKYELENSEYEFAYYLPCRKT